MRCKSHVGFGGRARETGESKDSYRALVPTLLRRPALGGVSTPGRCAAWAASQASRASKNAPSSARRIVGRWRQKS